MPDRLRNLLSPARLSPERAALRDELSSLMAERLAEGYRRARHDLLSAHRSHAHRSRDRANDCRSTKRATKAASQMAAGDATIGAPQLDLVPARASSRGRGSPWHAELDAVLGHSPIHADHLRKLVYTRRVLDEVLRLYPSVPITPRQALKRDVICGHKIPRGAVIVIAPWVVHRHRKLWSEPEAFDPDRFSDERSRDRPRFAHIPFIVGPGTCSGSHFAMAEMLDPGGGAGPPLSFPADPRDPCNTARRNDTAVAQRHLGGCGAPLTGLAHARTAGSTALPPHASRKEWRRP